MTKIRLLSGLSLIAILLAACAPSTATATDLPTRPAAEEPSVTPVLEPTAEQAQAVEATAVPPVEAQPVATSRGPDLHATDPTTVSLASGQLQFVEFFRFT